MDSVKYTETRQCYRDHQGDQIRDAMASKLYIRAEHKNNDEYETIKDAIYQPTIKKVGISPSVNYRTIAYS